MNGEKRQDATVADLIFDIPTLIEAISAGITLEPGDSSPPARRSGVGIGFYAAEIPQGGRCGAGGDRRGSGCWRTRSADPICPGRKTPGDAPCFAAPCWPQPSPRRPRRAPCAPRPTISRRRAVTMVVAFPPGGQGDVVARPVAAGLERLWKQPVPVVNRAGRLGRDRLCLGRPGGGGWLCAADGSVLAGGHPGGGAAVRPGCRPMRSTSSRRPRCSPPTRPSSRCRRPRPGGRWRSSSPMRGRGRGRSPIRPRAITARCICRWRC